jgi:ATP-dependent DNA helicase RecG
LFLAKNNCGFKVEILFAKYIRALISYEGISRIETYEYPKAALREALLNAIAHKNYAGCTPVQIRVYADRIKIWNEGQLPENWTVEDLLQEHSSRPYNPDIANAFFRSGYVESWGRGIEKMTEQCTKAKLPAPIITNKGSDFWITFRKDVYNVVDLGLLGLSGRQIKAVMYVKEHGKITNSEYQTLNSVSKRTATNDLSELVEIHKILKQLGASVGTHYEIV